MMIGTKPAVQSTGVWGSLVALLIYLGQIVGYHLTSADVMQAINSVAAIIGAVSTLIALWGRLRANKTITSLLARRSSQ